MIISCVSSAVYCIGPFILCGCTVGAPVQRTTRRTEAYPGQTDPWRTESSYHRLPVFLHAPRPLVALGVIRPVVAEPRAPQADLTALLLPLPDDPGRPGGAERSPVEVWCGMSSMAVRLDRLLLRAWPSPSQFRLGSCGPQKVTRRFIYFHSVLTDCDVESKVVGDQLMYSTSLFYDSPSQSPIIRVPPLNLPIHCLYNRFHYSYKVGFRPEVQNAIYAKTVRSKLIFSLTVCNAQWEALPPSSSFLLGEQVYFIARAGSLVSGERLYVDSCYIASSKDQNSLPKVHLITNYGCMMDSKRESSGSRFVWRGANELRFSVDAFLFKAPQVSQGQYLHCSMSVGLTASDTSKTCNYNRATGRWEEIGLSNHVCSCCDSVCIEKQESIKHTTTSIGWHVKVNNGNPSTRTSVATAEERMFVKKGNKRNKGVNPNLQVDKFQRSAITGLEETTQWKMGTIAQEATKERSSNITNTVPVDDLKGGTFSGLMSDESRASISNALREKFNKSKSLLDGIFNDSDLNMTSGKGFSSTANLDTICNISTRCTEVDVAVLMEIPHAPNNNTRCKASDVSIHFCNNSTEFNWKNSNQSLHSANLDAHTS